MSLTIADPRVREPHEPGVPGGGLAARRALIRWGLRLFRREWRQQILIVALLAVATAATVLGIAVATATPGTPNAGTFGTASALVILPPGTPDPGAAIAKIEKAYGPASVIYDQTLRTGMAQGADLRAQDPDAPYSKPLLALDSGRYPSGPAQVAVTAGLAQLYALRAGATWHVPASAGVGARSYTVTGVVEDPSNLLDEFALVAPGQVTHPDRIRVLLGVNPGSVSAASAAAAIPANAVVQEPEAVYVGITAAAIVLVVTVLGLVFIGLVASAGFTVMAQRRLRALGVLSSVGATQADVSFVMIVNGAAAGVAGALAGAALGFAGWFWYYPRLETDTAHRIDPLALPWPALVIGVLLAVATAVLAAAWPARAVSRIPIVAAISGRVAPPRVVTRSLIPGLGFLAGGLFLLYASGGWGGSDQSTKTLVPAGLVACVIACSLLAPLLVDALASLARRAPIATRLALRDLVRYRSRSGAVLAAVAFAVFLAAEVSIIASVRFSDQFDYAGPSLTSSQLILYAPGNDPHQYQSGQFTPAAKLAAARSQADALAASLHATASLELYLAVSPNVAQPAGAISPPGTPAQQNQPAGLLRTSGGRLHFSGALYVATPALLNAFKISSSQVAPNADILTMRQGLAGVANVALVSGKFFGEAPNGPQCPAGECIPNPVIQTLGSLPSGTSAPNTVITERAVRVLGVTVVPVGWLIQAPDPLTPAQISAARQAALTAGTTVETKSGQLGLTQISDAATLLGVAIALGVLAMTVGLIRSETVGDLRTLTATGASGRTRRALTGVTAGALALLGALLGSVVACLAGISWAHSSLTQTFGNVPPQVFALLLVGMPLLAAAAGWLLGGREPAAIGRVPVE